MNDTLVIVTTETKERPQFVRRAYPLVPEEVALRPAHQITEKQHRCSSETYFVVAQLRVPRMVDV